jgi:hypothetical protein
LGNQKALRAGKGFFNNNSYNVQAGRVNENSATRRRTMFKRLMLIGALVISVVAMSGTHANAQFFDGWGWFGFSSVKGLIDLSKVKNPIAQPSIVIATGTSNTAQIACVNPATNGISAGNAFTSELDDFDSVNPQKVTAKGDTTVTILFALDGLEINTNCQNRNWHPIEHSAMLLAFSAHLDWFKCTGEELDGIPDTDACTEFSGDQLVFTIDQTAKGLIQSADVSCFLDTSNPQNQRTATGTAPPQAVFTCTPPPPHK